MDSGSEKSVEDPLQKELNLLGEFEDAILSRKRKREPQEKKPKEDGCSGVPFSELETSAEEEEPCWACIEGTLTARKTNNSELLLQLGRLVQDLCMNVTTQRLVQVVGQWYEKYVRRPLLKEIATRKEKGLPVEVEDPGPWSQKSIRTHLFQHMLDLGLQQRRSIDTLRTLRETTLSHVVTKKKNGDVEINAKNLDAIMKIDMTLGKMFSLRPERAINYNPQLSIASGVVNKGLGTSLSKGDAEGQRNTKRDRI